MRLKSVLFLLMVLVATPLHAAEDGITTTDAAEIPPVDPEPDPYEEQKAEAFNALEDEDVGTKRIGGNHAVLAVYDPESPESGIRIVHVLDGASRTRGFTVRVTKRNGVNSQYDVTSEDGAWQVLAIKTNVGAKTVIEHRIVKTKRVGKRHRQGRTVKKVRVVSKLGEPATYVPYDPDLHTPEIEERGRQYLVDLIAAARKRLVTDDSPWSRVDAERRVPDLVSDDLLLTLMIIEHVGMDDFTKLGPEKAAGRVFATVGLNGAKAYRYARSSADARGLTQFIPSTYAYIQRAYPGAGLPENFRKGMDDHEHATVAQFCLTDWSLAMLPEPHRSRLLKPENEEELGAYLAAAYNGGEGWAVPAHKKSPQRLELARNRNRKIRRKTILPPETVDYVQKFRAIFAWSKTRETKNDET